MTREMQMNIFITYTLIHITPRDLEENDHFMFFFKKPMIGSKNVSITDNTANDIVDFDLIHYLNFYYILHTNTYLCDYQYKENIILIEDLYQSGFMINVKKSQVDENSLYKYLNFNDTVVIIIIEVKEIK